MLLNAVDLGQGEPVVLLHGLFGAAQNWGAIQKRLVATGRRVIALDLRNHGTSPWGAAMDYATLAADVAETIAGKGVARAAVIGHSMGGKVAMILALTEPGMVERLLVADIAPAPSGSGLGAYVAAMQAVSLHPGLTRRDADAALAPAVPQPGIRAFLLQNLRFEGGVPAWRLNLPAIAAAIPLIADFPRTEGLYPGSVLVLAGARSDYVRPEHRPAFRRLFPAVRFATIPDAGHWVHADNPDTFFHETETFLAQG